MRSVSGSPGDQRATKWSRAVGIVSYGRTRTYLPERADIVDAPTPRHAAREVAALAARHELATERR